MKLNIEHYSKTFSFEIKCCNKHPKVTKSKQCHQYLYCIVKCNKCGKKAKFSQFYQESMKGDKEFPRQKECSYYDFEVLK